MFHMIDELATIRAQIASLQIQEDELVELIKADGVGRYPGSVLDALVYNQERHHVDWNQLSKFLKIPKKIIKRFRRSQNVLCLKLVGKKRVK